MVYARHRRHLRRDPRHGDNLLEFIATQNARLSVAQAKASGVLTASAIADGDTVTIGAKVYTFQTTLTDVNGHVHRTGTLATDLGNLVKAIMLSGVAGTDYAASQTADANVTAVAGATTVTATAKSFGSAGNSIATTETSATASWGNTHLVGGADTLTFDAKAKLQKYTAEEIAQAASAAALP